MCVWDQAPFLTKPACGPSRRNIYQIESFYINFQNVSSNVHILADFTKKLSSKMLQKFTFQ